MTHSHHHSPDHEAERLSIGRLLFRVILAALIVGLLVAYSMYFQVDEGYKAVVTRFGKPVRAVHEAGPYWKWPWPIERARLVDVRRRLHNTPYSATFTRDRRNVVLLTYVVWYVEDPLLYIQSVGNRKTAEEKLNGMVVHRKHQYMGQHDLSALVSTDPAQIRAGEIEGAMLADVAKDAREKFGIEVEQVGIKRIAYPEENMPAVLQQMKEERIAEAIKLRALGQQVAMGIEDDALVKTGEILRQGKEEAGRIRGEAESEASKIYSVATALDSEFFTFWRQLQTLKRTLKDKATLILGTDKGVFQILREMPEPPSVVPTARPGVSATAPPATDQASALDPSSEEAP
jgi:membrane protease subunit HflC